MIFGLFFINNLFAQQSITQLLNCNHTNVTDLYPSYNEIVNRWTVEENSYNDTVNHHFISSFKRNVGAKRLMLSDIANLRPIVFVKVMPDTLTLNLKYQIDAEVLDLWRNDGYLFPWQITQNQQGGNAILNYGSENRMFDKDIVNNLPSSTCLFFVYFLKHKYACLFLAYKNAAGNLVFIERDSGTVYNSPEAIVNAKFGSFNNYVQKYYPKTTKKKVFVSKEGVVNGTKKSEITFF
ncbi:hypothetical protein FACS189429_7400 [Bacteroidia bacterium]|nr:hypothetical protein FACS189429_7400 [Bacteroidia bacterium]